MGSADLELVRVRGNQRYTFLATLVRRDLSLSVGLPAISQSPQHQNFYHCFPSSGTVKTSEYLAFFSGDCIRASKQLPRFKFKSIGSE